jgi:hypothetical protein
VPANVEALARLIVSPLIVSPNNSSASRTASNSRKVVQPNNVKPCRPCWPSLARQALPPLLTKPCALKGTRKRNL